LPLQVGVLMSFENEATFARLGDNFLDAECLVMACAERNEELKYHPTKAYFGAARALVGARLAFQYLSEPELQGQGSQFLSALEVLYVPHGLGLNLNQSLPALRTFASRGGHVVLDMPFGLYDGFSGAVADPSLFADLLGFTVLDLNSARNLPRTLPTLNYTVTDGLVADVALSGAEPLQLFADGTPAVLRNRFGNGHVTTVNFEASLQAWPQDAGAVQQLLGSLLRNTTSAAAWQLRSAVADQLLAFLRSSTGDGDAHHFFLFNPTAAAVTDVSVSTSLCRTTAQELLTDTNVLQAGGFALALPARSPAWVRCTP
jgi:hypothetical protein